jgi:Fur family peroxide stress response transcriptional regulator
MEKKQNYSKKREAILNVIRGTTSHPTAEWVYQQLKPEIPDLSLGTVYRNIAQFKKDGIIASVGVVNGQERYDGNIKPHTHFVCSGCGSVIDIPGEFLEENVEEAISKKYHLQVDSGEVIFRGNCSKCLQKPEMYKN